MKRKIDELRPVINKNFIIRVTFLNDVFKEVRLVGAGQYYKYVGEPICLRHFRIVLKGGLDEYTFFPKKSLKVEFISR